jgi:aldose 1-epimerase
MIKDKFDKIIDGKQIQLFTLTNRKGIKVQITNYGARIISINTPDKKEDFKDIVLGYDTIDEYILDDKYFGATVGRFANRIENGKLSIDGKVYQLAQNTGQNHLHGGNKGFSYSVWDVISIDKQKLELKYLSKDGEENYPGNLEISVVFKLTNKNKLKITYKAVTDKTTVVNLTQHSYFNLSGDANTSILNHSVLINADQFTPITKDLIPTGEIRNVENTPMDFRSFKTIGKDINSKDEQLKYGSGYDHNWVLKSNNKELVLAAAVHEPTSGRYMEVLTNQPGLQFYTGNFLNGTKGKNNIIYNNRSAFCFETQHFPDSPNQPNFPSTILNPNEEYSYSCIYKFSVK